MELTRFTEARTTSVVKPLSDLEGKDWDIVVIERGLSKNGFFYDAHVLREAVKHFEGLRVNAVLLGKDPEERFDHMSDEMKRNVNGNPVMNQIGILENVRYGTTTLPNGRKVEGILARLHILEGFKKLRENLKDLFSRAPDSMFGFSIDADGDARPGVAEGKRAMIVTKILGANSTDLVDHPAAGGAFTRLVASEGGGVKEIYELILGSRPAWLQGISAPDEGDDMKSYVTNVLESNLIRARQLQEGIDKSNTEDLLGVARGVNTIHTAIGLVEKGDETGALATLKGWFDAVELAESDKDGYGFPYRDHAPVEEPTTVQETAPAVVEEETSMDEPTEAAPDQEDVKSVLDETRKELAEARKLKRELLITSKLSESNLPDSAKDKVKALLIDKDDLTDEHITEAISEMQSFVASLSESGEPTGLGTANASTASATVEIGEEQEEKMRKALDGFFQMEDIDGVRRFTSMREAFAAWNGGRWEHPRKMSRMVYAALASSCPGHEPEDDEDYEAHRQNVKESYWPQVVRRYNFREAITTATFPVALGDSFQKALLREYTQDPRNDWRLPVGPNIVPVQDLTNPFRIQEVGGLDDLAIVNQGAPYQEITPTRAEQNTDLDTDKRGGLEKVTWEAVLADRSDLIARIPRDMGRAAIRTLSKAVWDGLETNPTVQGAALIDSATHTNEVTAGGGALTYDNLNSAIQLLQEQTELTTGERMGLTPKWLVVGPKLRAQARELVESSVKATTAEDATLMNAAGATGIQALVTLGVGRTTTTDDYWWVVADPRDAQGITVGFLNGRDRPDVFVQGVDMQTTGEMFNADVITWKIRFPFGVAVPSFRFAAGGLA
jgi:hypothetical protein